MNTNTSYEVYSYVGKFVETAWRDSTHMEYGWPYTSGALVVSEGVPGSHWIGSCVMAGGEKEDC
jgi:hypothetical protein